MKAGKTMDMEVEIVSKECIKPSFPTPHHLRIFRLCLLDQLIPSPYAPIVLFYPTNGTTPGCQSLKVVVPARLELLKKSLSETLTRYYPLAGKIKDDLSIDCTDDGAHFVEAKVNCHLFEFLSQPNLQVIQRFLPCNMHGFNGSMAGAHVANIQVNIFECGGIAIGICISHKIFDGAAFSTFLKCWTATARGSGEDVRPSFVAASLFPANDLWLRESSLVMWGSLLKKGAAVTKRFAFDAAAIASLQNKAASSCAQCRPTRVEAVSAFIWKCAMAVPKEKHGSQTPSVASHVVNLSRRTTLHLPEYSIGNLIWIASARCTAETEPELQRLVGLLRVGVSKIDDEFVKKLRSDERVSVIRQCFTEMGEGARDGVDYIEFTSWCKFGLYETDFGWGGPVWSSCVGLGGPVFMNFIILMDNKWGDGIEAWVTLDEQDMAAFQRHPEILKLAS